MMEICISINRVLKLAIRLTFFRFAAVKMATKVIIYIYGGIFGKRAER